MLSVTDGTVFAVGICAFCVLLNQGYLVFVLPFVWFADECRQWYGSALILPPSILLIFGVWYSGQVNYAGPSHPQNSVSADDLPKNVARNLNQGSCVMSMDFHPMQQSVLLGMYGP